VNVIDFQDIADWLAAKQGIDGFEVAFARALMQWYKESSKE
jgi:hypothetical protein